MNQDQIMMLIRLKRELESATEMVMSILASVPTTDDDSDSVANLT